MGFFSWKTADTKESIANAYSIHKNAGRTVYMLQPGGKEPIAESSYEGYGEFGGTDVHVWLCEQNIDHFLIDDLSEDDKATLGANLDLNSGPYRDVNTGDLFSFRLSGGPAEARIFGDITPFDGTYADPMKKYGKTPNELIAEGTWVQCGIREIVDFKYPLKFSYDPNAVYEDLPESQECEAQGFFYDEFCRVNQ